MNWFFCVLIVISSSLVALNKIQDQNNYGPYNVDFLKFELCKGPKKDDCGKIRMDNIHNMSNIPFVLDVWNDCPLKNFKISIGTILKNNRTKMMWNSNSNTPCQHFLLGPLFIKTFDRGFNNCTVPKGHYKVPINMNDLTTKFLGTKFFYETYFFKTIAYNNVNNFFCTYHVVKISKRD